MTEYIQVVTTVDRAEEAAAVKSGRWRGLPAQPDDLGSQVPGPQELTDPTTLLQGCDQRRSVAEPAPQLMVDGGDAPLPPGGRRWQGRRIGSGGLGQASLVKHPGQLGAGQEVVAFRRVVQRIAGGQEYQ
jgi:hypothetical protein